MATAKQLQFKLKRPVVIKGDDGEPVETIDKLVLRTTVCAGDLRGIPIRSPPYAEDILKMLSRLTGKPEVVLDKLSIDDFSEVGEIVIGFFAGSPALDPESPEVDAGKTPSE